MQRIGFWRYSISKELRGITILHTYQKILLISMTVIFHNTYLRRHVIDDYGQKLANLTALTTDTSMIEAERDFLVSILISDAIILGLSLFSNSNTMNHRITYVLCTDQLYIFGFYINTL